MSTWSEQPEAMIRAVATRNVIDSAARADFALKWLAERTDPSPAASAADWRIPTRTVYAFELADALLRAGLTTPGRRDYHRVNGAANTLSALRRRGLAANDGGGAWIQARWWITPKGAEAVAE